MLSLKVGKEPATCSINYHSCWMVIIHLSLLVLVNANLWPKGKGAFSGWAICPTHKVGVGGPTVVQTFFDLNMTQGILWPFSFVICFVNLFGFFLLLVCLLCCFFFFSLIWNEVLLQQSWACVSVQLFCWKQWFLLSCHAWDGVSKCGEFKSIFC